MYTRAVKEFIETMNKIKQSIVDKLTQAYSGKKLLLTKEEADYIMNDVKSARMLYKSITLNNN